MCTVAVRTIASVTDWMCLWVDDRIVGRYIIFYKS